MSAETDPYGQPTLDALTKAWGNAFDSADTPGASLETLAELRRLRAEKTTWVGEEEMRLRFAIDSYLRWRIEGILFPASRAESQGCYGKDGGLIRMTLTPAQLNTLRHMLGVNTPSDRVPKPYRDYYCACAGDPEMAELAAAGAVELLPNPHWSGDYYVCTPAGRAAAMASHRTIRRSKGSRVYCRFLSVRDCFADLTFHDFLTDPQFAETRANA